jgi:hypothetical protein
MTDVNHGSRWSPVRRGFPRWVSLVGLSLACGSGMGADCWNIELSTNWCAPQPAVGPNQTCQYYGPDPDGNGPETAPLITCGPTPVWVITSTPTYKCVSGQPTGGTSCNSVGETVYATRVWYTCSGNSCIPLASDSEQVAPGCRSAKVTGNCNR